MDVKKSSTSKGSWSRRGPFIVFINKSFQLYVLPPIQANTSTLLGKYNKTLQRISTLRARSWRIL